MHPLLLTIPLALSSPSARTDFEQCAKQVREKPEDYDAARCFMAAASRHKAYLEAQASVSALKAQHPEAIYLDLIRANLLWSTDPKAAVKAYRDCAEHYARSKQPLGELISRANAAQLLFWRFQENERADQEMRRVQEIVEQSDDPKLVQRGRLLVATYSIDIGANLGATLRLLREVSASEIAAMEYSVQRELFIARSTCALYQHDFKLAKSDLQQLEALSRAKQDRATQALAAYYSASVLIEQLAIDPQRGPDFHRRTKEQLLKSIDIAKQAQNHAVLARAVADLSSLFAGHSNDEERKRELMPLLEDCLERTKGLQGVHGLCQTAKSLALREQDPKQALTLAVAALEELGQTGQHPLRIYTLRAAMHRSWELSSVESAIRIARYTINAIDAYREAQRGEVARQEIFSTWTQDFYWLSSRLLELSLKDSKYLAEAFEILERSRSRVLLEIMTSPRSELGAQEGAQEATRSILQQIKSSASASAAQAAEPSERSTTATLTTIQEQLEEHEAMLVYQSGAERSFDGESMGGAWALVITHKNAHAVKLPTNLANLRNAVEIYRDLIRRDEANLEVVSTQLRKLIFDPLRARIPSQVRELVVVPDGPLHALPFSVVAPQYPHSISPSATIWSTIRKNNARTLVPSGLSVVDPHRENSAAQARREPYRGSGQGDIHLPLPASKREAKAINTFLGAQLRSIQGTQATPSRLTQTWRPQDNLLHIAAHSEVLLEEPQRSSLLLANAGRPDDGRLSAKDIAKLPAKNAVVVLAGCATGWGTLLAGEGVLSLARAFQRAGASTVVASLWPIRDELTAEFFERFYEILGQGKSIAQALADTRAQMQAMGHPASTFHGFVALGDASIRFQPGPQAISPAPSKRWRWYLGLGALCSLALVAALRRRNRKKR